MARTKLTSPVAALALALLALYGLLAFGVRVVVQLRRTGSTGFKGLSGAPGSAEWISGMLFAAAIALCVAGPILQLTAGLDQVKALEGGIGQALGASLAIVGILMTVLAQFAMGDAWRIGVDPSERTELVTGGPFSVVRNPIYAAMVPFFAGVALLSPNVLIVGGAGLLVVALELQTRLVEEPYLSKIHGEEYLAYAAQVGRFLPRIGRLRSGDERQRNVPSD